MADITTTYQLNFTGDQINNLLARTNNLDTELNNYLLKNGGDMTGSIAMGGNKMTGLGTPTATGDAATKAYVDGKRFTKTATISASWSGSAAPYTQSVTVSGILATDFPILRRCIPARLLPRFPRKKPGAW